MPEAVEPSEMVAGAAVPLAIRGWHFYPGAVARFDAGTVASDTRFAAWLGSTPLTEVRWVSEEELAAVAPATIDAGLLDLVVADPRGRTGALAEAVLVVVPAGRLVIEDAPDGAGAEVLDLELHLERRLTLHAVARGPDGAFVSNAATAVWEVQGGIGSLDVTTGSMARLTVERTVTGAVQAELLDLGLSDATGTLTAVCIQDRQCTDPCHAGAKCVARACVLGASDRDVDQDGLVDHLCPGGTDCNDSLPKCGAVCTDPECG